MKMNNKVWNWEIDEFKMIMCQVAFKLEGCNCEHWDAAFLKISMAFKV